MLTGDALNEENGKNAEMTNVRSGLPIQPVDTTLYSEVQRLNSLAAAFAGEGVTQVAGKTM